MKNNRLYWICDRCGVPVVISKRNFYAQWRFYKICLMESKIVIVNFEDGNQQINLYHRGKQILYYFTK